jgi:protein TonB
MRLSARAKVASGILAVLLAACGHAPPPAPAPAARTVSRPPPAQPAAPGQRAAYDNLDMYKNDVAMHVVRYNAAHTFIGPLPPMLPAIVVLSITVDSEGRMTKVAVVRSRDSEATRVALASMQRSEPLPRPFNLVGAHNHSLTFSETFLFNADYRFQLRTLAPVQ